MCWLPPGAGEPPRFWTTPASIQRGYGAAEKLLAACGYTREDVETGGLEELKTRAEAIGLDRLAETCGAGNTHPWRTSSGS